LGWISFTLACSIGAIANVGIAAYIFQMKTSRALAALAGINNCRCCMELCRSHALYLEETYSKLSYLAAIIIRSLENIN